jgi:stress-induced-phosphoprotein 1
MTCDQCIEILPSFSKGHARKGAALHGLRQFPEAVMAYEAGLQIEPQSDVLKRGLADVQKALENDSAAPFANGGDMGLGRMFSDPGLVAKLENHPKTREHMKDPQFRQSIAAMQAGGGRNIQSMMADPRMLTVLGVAMGIDIVSPKLYIIVASTDSF